MYAIVTCIHSANGLCRTCQAEYDADPDAYIEFGQHPAGEARWKEELEKAAND